MKPNARSPSKPPLITPSVSPPPTLSSRRPVKKQRTGLTPGRSFQDSASSHSRSQTPADVHQDREASRSRLLDVWAGLARRYSRHMDEDDLVDIRTGEIIKDNGVLRNAPTLEFGTLAAPEDGSSGAEYDDDPYDQDELDTFTETDDSSDLAESGKYDVVSNGKSVSTSSALDAADAEDLQEFLEAERIRREQWGVDVDEVELEETQSSEENVSRAVQQRESGTYHDYGVEAEEDSCSESCKEDEVSASRSRKGTFDDPELIESSGDELNNWAVDESNEIRVVHKDEPEDSENEVEIFEIPKTRGSPSARKTQTDRSTRRSRPITRQLSRQLYTPPHSSSGSMLSPVAMEVDRQSQPALSLSRGGPVPLRERSSSERPKNKRSDKLLPISEMNDDLPSSLRSTSKRSSMSNQDDDFEGSSRHQTPKKCSPLVSDPPASLKRKRVSQKSIYPTSEAGLGEESEGQTSNSNHSPTSYKRTASKHSVPAPESLSVSHSDYDSDSSEKFRRKHSLHSRASPFPRQLHGPDLHVPPGYPSQTNEVFLPVPDPRAQLIIAQAMQQLSALMGLPWQPPNYYSDTSVLQTPSRRQMHPPGHRYATPKHNLIQPRIDPSFSHATLPPETPEFDTVQESSKRRALVHRSHSRGRRVSFSVDDNSPSKRKRSNRELEEAKVLLHEEEWSSEEVSEYEQDKSSVGLQYTRSQTPGPPTSRPSRRRTRT